MIQTFVSGGAKCRIHGIIMIIMLLGTLLPLSGKCQESYFSLALSSWSPEIGKTTSAALGDVNGDGYLDLVCGNIFEGNALYLNDGKTFPSLADWTSNLDYYTRGVALGDIDSDGDLDLVCGNAGQKNTLYLNENGMLQADAAWSSDLANNTHSVALGDVDGDGDLDLVCGNALQKNTLYINEGGMFQADTAWSSNLANNTYSIALGDIDDDGDLDLVCGNWNQKNTLYLNENGMFQPDTAWSSRESHYTRCVALGDIDGDGDLDLVCGNFNQSNTIYLNDDGILRAEALTWTTMISSTTSVSMADFDGDGDLDLVCGNSGQRNTLYVNDGGMFEPDTTWSSEDALNTQGVTPGDVDGDGDLDLVCANYDASSTLYTNDISAFQESPWSSETTDNTYSVALGDIDSDGDLDLVCGNFYHTSALYICDNGTLQVSQWESLESENTSCVALGDVDGDGDLDLVCGNVGQKNTLYLNENGMIQPDTAWSSDLMNSTYSVALGDIDGDGDLDLVCGNAGQQNTLYLNEGGMFQTSPTWYSGVSNNTLSIALGDINGDGELDLICGNRNERNKLYLNVGGTFQRYSTDWSSFLSNYTTSVAMGDIDRDGDLDLVCGNYEQSNTLYLNDNGVLQSWSEPIGFEQDATTSIALEDIDYDGSLDLIFGNYAQNNRLYINNEGTFQAVSDLPFEINDNTQSVAVGDVDGDGDCDLVFGNYIQSNTLYYGKRSPAFKGDPFFPTNHLPNNGGYLRFVTAESINEIHRVRFAAVDVESDPFWLVAEYKFSGDAEWQAASIYGGFGKIGPFEASPAGSIDSLDWDTRLLPFDSRYMLLRLRVIEVPKHLSVIQHAATYTKVIGSFEPYRPEIYVSPSEISFSTVTVGDTVSVDIVVGNSGYAPLEVSGINLPSLEMHDSWTTPNYIERGACDTLTIFSWPREGLEITGSVWISNDDPFQAMIEIPVDSADIRALEVETELLVQEDEIPLGEAVIAVIRPYPDVRVERGWLLYRPGSSEEAFSDSVRLENLESDFMAVIPGRAVTEAGLEYYVLVENSGVFGTDPPGAPDAYFTQAVQNPNSISAVPRPNSVLGFTENIPIYIDVTIQQGTIVVDGFMHYRLGGESEYLSIGPAYMEPSPIFMLPDSVVGPRGIEYWIELQTIDTVLTYPSHDPERSPEAIRVTVRDLEEPEICSAEEYRMVSIPLDIVNVEDFTLEAMLSDQAEFGPYDPLQWRCFRWVSEELGYSELSDQDAADHFQPIAGASFWLISKDANHVSTAPLIGYSTPTGNYFPITLLPGRNMIGNPYAFDVAWDSVLIDTLSGEPLTIAEAEGVAIEPLVSWTVDEGYGHFNRTFRPFGGYWVKNLLDTSVVLLVPPEAAADVNPVDEPLLLADEEGDGWSICIETACGSARDGFNIVGVKEGGQSEWDGNDISEPPMCPGPSLSLYFPHSDWRRHPGAYTKDIRGGYEKLIAADLFSNEVEDDIWGHIWRFDVAKSFSMGSGGDEVTLEFSAIDQVPAEAAVYLIDRKLEKLVDVRASAVYSFFEGKREAVETEEETRFVLIVGSEEFVAEHGDELPTPPAATVLHQNYPNPFNPATVVRYDIARAGEVTISIYDVKGSLVKVLEKQYREPGRYEVGWNGENERGAQVASGIYFYRMRTPYAEQTRKMILLR